MTTAGSTHSAAAPTYISPIRRPHTILGVCEALGEDFGFNPLWLRIAFAAGLFFNATMVIAVYLALGALVALSRWIAPVRFASPAAAPVETGSNDAEELKIAA